MHERRIVVFFFSLTKCIQSEVIIAKSHREKQPTTMELKMHYKVVALFLNHLLWNKDEKLTKLVSYFSIHLLPFPSHLDLHEGLDLFVSCLTHKIGIYWIRPDI